MNFVKSSSEKSGGIFWWWGQKQESRHRNQGDGYPHQWIHPSREEQVEEPNEEGLQTADCFWLSHHHHLPVHNCHHSELCVGALHQVNTLVSLCVGVWLCVCKGWIKSSSLKLIKIYWIYFFDFMILDRCISVEAILCIILYSLEQAWTWVTQTTASFQKYVQGLWTATANKSGGKWSSDLDLGQSKGSCSTSWSITVQFYEMNF